MAEKVTINQIPNISLGKAVSYIAAIMGTAITIACIVVGGEWIWNWPDKQICEMTQEIHVLEKRLSDMISF